jgi:hypothetical protein
MLMCGNTDVKAIKELYNQTVLFEKQAFHLACVQHECTRKGLWIFIMRAQLLCLIPELRSCCLLIKTYDVKILLIVATQIYLNYLENCCTNCYSTRTKVLLQLVHNFFWPMLFLTEVVIFISLGDECMHRSMILLRLV